MLGCDECACKMFEISDDGTCGLRCFENNLWAVSYVDVDVSIGLYLRVVFRSGKEQDIDVDMRIVY